MLVSKIKPISLNCLNRLLLFFNPHFPDWPNYLGHPGVNMELFTSRHFSAVSTINILQHSLIFLVWTHVDLSGEPWVCLLALLLWNPSMIGKKSVSGIHSTTSLQIRSVIPWLNYNYISYNSTQMLFLIIVIRAATWVAV